MIGEETVCLNLVPDDKFKDNDEVLVVYKFKGTHKSTKIRCTYIQYKNLKDLQSIEYCKIVQE
ncbi:MAG: hypothetical protein HZA82_06475 [Thaumarchaeota archaeon]|nr:hypothetical protein [Nitrososphaerota archaeon]